MNSLIEPFMESVVTHCLLPSAYCLLSLCFVVNLFLD